MMTKNNQRKLLKILLVIPISPNTISVITPDRNDNYTRRCLHLNAVIKKKNRTKLLATSVHLSQCSVRSITRSLKRKKEQSGGQEDGARWNITDRTANKCEKVHVVTNMCVSMDPYHSYNQASVVLSLDEIVTDLPDKITIFSFWKIHSSIISHQSFVTKLYFRKGDT